MRLKRIGPSIIPTEVVVPLAEMAAVLDEIDEKIKQPFILEGMVGKGDKVVLLGFIPHDQRTVRVQRRVRAVAVGHHHREAPRRLRLLDRPVLPPRGRVACSATGRRREAPGVQAPRSTRSGVMNPGKVLGRGAIDVLMGTASAFEPLVRPIANAANAPTGDMSA